MKNALVGIVMLVVVLWGTGWFLAGHSYVNKTTEPEVRVVTEHIQAPSNAHLIDLMNYYQTEAEKARKELWEKENITFTTVSHFEEEYQNVLQEI